LPTQKEGFTASLKENNLKGDEVARVGGAAEETNIVLSYDALKKGFAFIYNPIDISVAAGVYPPFSISLMP
ncbi:unnamed protein product, partial [Rotaria magnacalcarata]